MSNRSLKLQLHSQNPRCHWCKRQTKLTNLKAMRGKPDPLMATIDHVISRYHPHRWVKRLPAEQRKVLACYECNHRRSVQETLSLSRAEILRRSQGYSLSPKGKPTFEKPLPTLEDAIAKLNCCGKVLA